MKYDYGYFSKDGTEFIITTPKTPRAYDNFIWNEAVFSNIQQTGVGYLDYQVEDKEAVQLLTGVGRICDFDVFGRDHLMSRLIYVRDNQTGEFWNVNWEPVKKAYEEYRCIHGIGYTTIKTRVNGLGFVFKIFIPKGKDPVELWELEVENPSEDERNLSIFVYNQFQFKYKWGFDSYGDMIFRGSWFEPSLNAMIANKHPYTKPHDYLMGFITSNTPIVAYDGTRDAFVGQYNTLCEPEAVMAGHCSNTPGSSDATIAAIQFDLKIKKSETKKVSMILGATNKEERITQYKEKYFGHYEFYFHEMQRDKQAYLLKNTVKTPDEHFNRMLNTWIKQGTLYGATWCRWGWSGYRDIVQHGLGVVSLDPLRTKNILLKALEHQYQSGLALRGWNPVDEKAYSDSALWLVFTLVSYIKETGDTNILQEEVPFYDGGNATVYQHIDRALDFLEKNKGAHSLCLIKFGDWNDSLTAVGKEGRGESTWLSEAYAEALREMAGLSEFLEDSDKKNDYLKRYRMMKEAINQHAWDGEWFVRCYDDKGAPVGSNQNKQGKIFTNAQSWALIAGIADKERTQKLIQSCDEMLKTDLGYMLLTPTFTEFDDNIGRISCLEPGVCENGTIYSHVNIWMILGLIRAGFADKAYALFKKITPGYVEEDRYQAKQNAPPYMYANCYFGKDHRNRKFQMEFTWITGSLAWFNHVLVNEMIGAKADYKGLRIEPNLPSCWESCHMKRNYRNAVYDITVKNPERLEHGRVQVFLEGVLLHDSIIPVFNDGKIHKVEVMIESCDKNG